MAGNAGFSYTFRANESIGAYLCVAANASSTSQFLCELADTSTSVPLGIIQDAVSTDGAANVSILGVCRAQCGASVSSGARITWQTATGKIVEGAFNTTTGYSPHNLGVALQAGSTDAVIKVLLNPNYIVASS